MKKKHRDKDRAKAIIVEIIRQAGGTFPNKTNLFKAFWRAHVVFARSHITPLSDWPIVRMPKGPGIHQFTATLLKELIADGILDIEEEDCGGGKVRLVFHIAEDPSSTLATDEIAAIKSGVEYVEGKWANTVSENSHDDSRAWRLAENGDELDLFLDTIPDEEYESRNKRMSGLLQELDSLPES